MTSIDRRQGFERTRTSSQSGARAPRWILPLIATAWSCLPPSPDIQCVESENCDQFSGGACRSAPSGNRWCSYPDAECPSGHRFSDLDVGDELSGACTETPGQPRWALQLGGIGWDYGEGITTDGEGNVIAVGTFSGSLNIGGVTLTSAGGDDIFVVKLSGITGATLWAKRFGGLDDEQGTSVRADVANNLYVMGGLDGAADLGGGELRSVGGKDMFVLKLSPDGGHVWSRRLGGILDDQGQELAVRGDAIAIVGARTQGQGVAFASVTRQSFGYVFDDLYIEVLTLDGGLLWSKTLGGPGPDAGLGVALDSSGDVIVVGEFQGTVNLGGGPLTSANESWDVFVAKYAGVSGSHLFSKRYGGTQTDVATAVTVDAMDNIVVIGVFHEVAQFGGPSSLSARSNYGDIFVSKYTLAGAYLWARSFSAIGATGPGYLAPEFVTVDSSGDVVITGQFCGTISFGGVDMSASCSGTGVSAFNQDTFAVRLSGTNASHISSVRTGSRSEATRMALTTDGRLHIVGHFDKYAELGGDGFIPVSGTDVFVLTAAPL